MKTKSITDLDISSFVNYISDLESPFITFEDKIQKIRRFRGLRTGEEILRELVNLFALDETWRMELITYTLTEVMDLPGEEVKRRLAMVADVEDVMAEAVKHLNGEGARD